MNHQNLLLQDDAFSPPVPDTLENLPSHHTEQPDRRVLQAKGKYPAPCARSCESNAYEIELHRLKARNALLESKAEQLRMSVRNARIDIDGLMDIVRTLVCVADRMAQPSSEHYPSPLSDFSPLMIAARQTCVDHGFTEGGIAIPSMTKDAA